MESTGPAGKRIITETGYDNLGRVSEKSNPYFYGIDTPYYTSFTYDGLSRVIETQTPDGYFISTYYQGLKKVVTDQNNHSTGNTYDVYQRLMKVEDAYGTITEYSFNTLGNLVQVIAAKGNTEQNTTTMTYDSLSKKRTMTDPDMGYWTYDYDKSGNLEYQTDAKSQKIRLIYDGINRVYERWYGYPTPTSRVYFTYDDPLVPYSKGKQTKVSYQPSGEDLREDSILEYDLLQRVKKSKKKIGTNEITFEKSYDSGGKVVSIKYLAGTPNEKVYSYEYDVAGNLLYVKDNATGNHLVDYSGFTALGQQKSATFPKPNNVSVKSTYTYDPPTARLKTLLTQKLVGEAPTDTYQNLDYQQFDGKGNLITLADNLNAINHGYTYDSLDRLLTSNGAGTNPYTQSYQYDRIGNITFKSDVGSYSYTYSNKPHAVRTAGNISSQYDLNGNMTQRRVSGGIRLDITYNYDNKPSLIKKNGSNYVQFTHDGNSQRVKKYNYTTGQTTLYFGGLYETRGGVGIVQVFAGSQRVASVLGDGRTQFYHTDHLGSASVITDSNGNRKEQMVYFPFGTYRAVGNINGTYDYDPSFPDVFYTFTGQEDDDDLGFYNYGARLYDPLLGRFISPDTMVPDPNNPQSLNRYSYTLNNPLRYIDPSGNVEWDVEWYDQGEVGSDYGTWGSSWNLSLNFRPPRASFYSNYIIYNDSLIYRGIYPSTNQQHMLDWSDISEWPLPNDIQHSNYPNYIRKEPVQPWIYIPAGLGGGYGALSAEYGRFLLVDPKTLEYHQFGYFSGGGGLSLQGWSLAAQLEGGVLYAPRDPTKMPDYSLTLSGFAAWGKGYSGQFTTTGLRGNGEWGWSTGVAGGWGANASLMVTYSWHISSGTLLPEKYLRIYQQFLNKNYP